MIEKACSELGKMELKEQVPYISYKEKAFNKV